MSASDARIPAELYAAKPATPRRGRRGRYWRIAIVVASAVVVVLLMLIGVGILRLPSTSPAPYSIEAIQWTLVQGTILPNATGCPNSTGWFGVSPFTWSGTGYPMSVTPGGTFTINGLLLKNCDSVTHNVTAIEATAPFSTVSVSPTLPAAVLRVVDSAYFKIAVSVPNDPGGSGVLDMTIMTN